MSDKIEEYMNNMKLDEYERYYLFIKRQMFLDAVSSYHCKNEEFRTNHNAMDRCCVLEGCVVQASRENFAELYKEVEEKYYLKYDLRFTDFWGNGHRMDLEEYASFHASKWMKQFFKLLLDKAWLAQEEIDWAARLKEIEANKERWGAEDAEEKSEDLFRQAEKKVYELFQ